MLDVHPPEHAPHTWRDFFIHIATIVIGLLIAVGLEQSVEYLHQRHQVREAHAMLRQEFEGNRSELAGNAARIDAHLAQLWDDLAVVSRARAHQGRPGDHIAYVRSFLPFQNSAWQTVHASSVTEHMDPREMAGYGVLYQIEDQINAMSTDVGNKFQDSLSPLVATEDHSPTTTEQTKVLFSQEATEQKDMQTAAARAYDNHPERLTPVQLDRVEEAIQQGIIGDRRIQRYLAALAMDYAEFDKS
jgi:hypothetical protein